jgi:hypothetical protein
MREVASNRSYGGITAHVQAAQRDPGRADEVARPVSGASVCRVGKCSPELTIHRCEETRAGCGGGADR